VRGAYSLGDYLAESFAEGCHIDRRGLEAVYKRENGFGLTLPSIGRAFVLGGVITHGTERCAQPEAS
jgi:hypothetical protein